MKRAISHLVVLSVFFFATCLIVGCSSSSSDDNGGGGGGGDGEDTIVASGVNVIMNSNQLASANIAVPASIVKAQTQTSCTIATGPTTDVSGKCITPLNISGNISSISVSTHYEGGTPARILGGGAELALDSTGAVAVESFTLSNADQISSGEDNITDTTYYFDRIQLLLASLDVKFAAASKYFTARYVFYEQPILDNSIIDACITNQEYRDDIAENGDLFPDMSFQSGDILICQKDTADEACEDSDFQWVDTSAGTLSSDRSSIAPANIAQVNGQWVPAQDVDCEDNGGDMSLGGSNINAVITSPFVITAVDNASGTGKTYTYTPDCTSTGASTGSCTGAEQSGTNVAFVIDYDVDESVFVNSTNIADIDTVSVTDLLKNITSVMLKPLYILNNTTVPYAGGLNPGWDATVTATLSSSTFGQCTTDDECNTWAATIATESAASLGATKTINIQNPVCATFSKGKRCTRECTGNDIMHAICPQVNKGYGWGGIGGTMACTTDTGGDTTQECPSGQTCYCTFSSWY